MSYSNNAPNSSSSLSKNQLKNILNFKFGKAALNSSYGLTLSKATKVHPYYEFDYCIEATDEENLIKFKPSKTQFKRILKNLNKIKNFNNLFEIFTISEDQRFEMFQSIKDGDILIKSCLIRYLHDFDHVYAAIESYINDSNFFNYLTSCENLASIFSTFARQIIDVNKVEDHSKALFEMFERLERKLEEFPNELKEELLSSLDEHRKDAYKDNFLLYDKKEIIEKIFSVIDQNNEIPSIELIQKYGEYLSFRKIVSYYKKNNADIEYSEQIAYYLKKQVEKRIFDELGPAAKVININMEWDMNTIALFDEINDEGEEDEAY